MALTDEEIKQLFLVQRTLMQMLKDRGYSIEDSEITMTLGEFIEKYGENMKRKALVTLKAKKNDDNDKVCINIRVVFIHTRSCGLYNLVYWHLHRIKLQKSSIIFVCLILSCAVV